MLAGYLEYLNRCDGAALLRRIPGGEVHANAEGRSLLDHAGAECDAAFAEAERTGTIVQRVVDGRALTFVPLLTELEGLEGVLATTSAPAEMPRLLRDLHSSTRHFAEIVDLLPHIVLTARPNGRIDYASRRWSDVVAAARSTDLHESVLQAVADVDREAVTERWNAGIASGDPFGFEFRLQTRGGARWYALSAMPWRPRREILKWSVSLTDVDAAVRARTALERSRRRLRMLADVGKILNGATEAATIARDVSRLLAAWCGGTGIVELRDRDDRVAVGARPADGRLLVERIATAVARSASLSDIGVPGLWAAPICRGERARGFTAVVWPEPPSEADRDAQLLADIADRIAATLENIIIYQREQRIANELQRSMLPVALPQVPGVLFDVAYTPAASEMLVGGDWYDAFVLRDGRVAFAIGDVAGHGLDAAIVMGNVRRTIRAAALDERSAARILAHANAVVCAERCPMVTAFLGVLDPLTLRLEYACAGHPPPILVDRDGGLTALEADGPPLGVLETAVPQLHALDLAAQTALVLYTDGVVEAQHDPASGELTLHAILRTWGTHTFEESAEVLAERAIGTAAHGDDAAMLVVRLVHVEDLDITFRANTMDGRRARFAVQRYVKEAVAGEQRAFDFTLAIAEAINNAAEHAYHGGAGTVRVRLSTEPDRVVAVIEDTGRWRPTLSLNRGRGLALMRALTDACDVDATDAGTTVTLAMRRSGQSAARA